MTFQDGKYRTEELNIALLFILHKNNKLRNEKPRNIVISENVSGYIPSTGAFSNQLIDGMRKTFELEPVIKIHSISTNRAGEKLIQEAAVASL